MEMYALRLVLLYCGNASTPERQPIVGSCRYQTAVPGTGGGAPGELGMTGGRAVVGEVGCGAMPLDRSALDERYSAMCGTHL